MACLAGLVPKPRVNLTRFHGVFAPNSQHRARITPAGRGKGGKTTHQTQDRTPAQRQAAMSRAQRLKRVFNIDITMKVIACIEDPDVIRKIPAHPGINAPTTTPSILPERRAPPQVGLFDRS